MDGDIFKLLVDLKIIDSESVYEFAPQVRDDSNLKVYRCSKSGVVFLKDGDHIKNFYYENKEGVEYWSAKTRDKALLKTVKDDQRRSEVLKPYILEKNYLDVGTGLGGILDLVKGMCKQAHGVEVQNEIREILNKLGYKIFPSLEALDISIKYDVISLFHVFEHLIDPINSLQIIKKSLSDEGLLIIEVPHANDFLIKLLDCAPFKKFTLWSEHLILHTRASLETMLKTVGFTDITVTGIQRYPLSNHLYWLSKGLPGGHDQWSFLDDNDLYNSYSKKLAELDMTDTLIAYARKG